MSGWRLGTAGRVDRGKQVAFRWAGRTLHGYAGDTLASALMANGVSIVGRSFKYHRPRGLLAAGLEEPNAIVQLETGAAAVPNVKATQIELYEGLVANPVNAKPSVEFDLLAVNSLFKPFIPAAFYYKTFMWPNWHWFEPAIRKAAGLGDAPEESDPDSYDHRFAHTDIVVVGSGAAGLAAAIAAAKGGEQVLLVEADAELGGGLLAEPSEIEGVAPLAWRDRMLVALAGLPNVTVMNRTMAFGFYDHQLVGLCERVTDHLPPQARSGPRQRLWKVRTKRVILATGAFERPIAFAGNDLPGVMLASAAQTYALRYGVAPGRRIVVATNNDSAYHAAFALHDAGVVIAAIVDSRTKGGNAVAGAMARGIRTIMDSAPIKAKGRRRVKGLTLGKIADGKASETIACDTILMSNGWNPAVHLHSQSGGSLAFNSSLEAFLPSKSVQAAVNVGAAAGIFDLEIALASGRAAGQGDEVGAPFPAAVGPTLHFADGDMRAAKAWVDFQNDVTAGDVQIAARENFRSVEHLKRYTTLGMASDQGKTSNVTGIHMLASLLGKPPQAIGTTKFRPPFDPVTIGGFAGRAVGENLMPIAHSAAHASALAAGAKMENYGSWLRPAYFPRTGEDEHAAVAREVLAVRGQVGLFDASPLGKIEVKGPDAAEFLQRIYVNGVRNLKVGRCRYGLMLSEHGIVYDDGVFAKIAEDHFLVGTTSGHAAAIADMLQEWLQCEWTDLKVLVENVTTAWAVMNVAGPKARAVLEGIGTDIDLSREAFPHMSYREGRVGGVPARIQRVSFSGELSYEVSVPWGYGRALWDAMMQAGAPHGITPFGVEALMALRIEKGFLHVGSDTDGTTMPQDVGFGVAVSKKPDDFIGRRSTMTPEGLRGDRRQLVGLETLDAGGAFECGAHIVAADAKGIGATQGWVTSSVQSPTLGRPLAMALIERGTARIGETVRVWNLGKGRPARIVDPRFYDPAGGKLDG
ncbi:MAG TPA: sarcosine oxidase subunit alpha family protein [Sphingopyxis sp.]|nr:sarcosine oxidase subunit alpha family protein [Sphingopyxis sp.]